MGIVAKLAVQVLQAVKRNKLKQSTYGNQLRTMDDGFRESLLILKETKRPVIKTG